MVVLIPAYKEDVVILDVAKSALKQNYPLDKFDIVVIADSLKNETLLELKQLPIVLIEVSFEQSTKSKALNKAMASLTDSYDYAVVLDADNIMEPNFILKMNVAFENGFKIVQAHRTAKNVNTSFAILDAASEEINNSIFRQGHRALGLSSGLIGSGMGFCYKLFKPMMATVAAVGGFDKELEFKFAKKKITIEYLQDAVVYDEKIQKASDFSNQRRRWLATQFIYLKTHFKSGLKELVIRGNVTFFDKVFQMLIPPRVLLLGGTFLLTLMYSIVAVFSQKTLNIPIKLWWLNLSILVVAFLLALPTSFYTFRTLKSLLSLPMAFMRMFILLFKLKGANKKFIHTAHGVVKN